MLREAVARKIERLYGHTYDPGDEITVLWNDPAIGIDWPVQEPTLSVRDRNARPLAELLDRLPKVAV